MGALNTIYKVKHGSEVFHMTPSGVGFNVHQFACSIFKLYNDERFHWSIHLKGWDDVQEENVLYASGNSLSFRGAVTQKALTLHAACEDVFGRRDYGDLIHEEYIISDDLEIEVDGKKERSFLSPGWLQR